jgi:hypothetical protein
MEARTRPHGGTALHDFQWPHDDVVGAVPVCTSQVQYRQDSAIAL